MTDLDAAVTVHEAFERTRRIHGHRPFLHIPAHCAGGPVELSYERAGREIERLAAAYRAAGHGPGTHIGLLLGNRAPFFIHWLALNSLGATIVPLGSELTPDEAAFVLSHGDVDLLVYFPEFAALAEQAAARSGTALAPIDQGAHDDHVTVPELAECRSPRDRPPDAAIVFTSGSTGRPKGCRLSNDYFLSFGRWYRDLGGRCTLREGLERLITPLPLNHVNALAFSSMGMILSAGCIVQLDRFHSSSWWSSVRDSGATVMHYLGVMPAMLLQLPPAGKDRDHSVHFGFGGGVRAEHHARFEERFGIPLIEAWAMTETGGAGTISTHEGARHIGSGCIGRPSPRYGEARVVDEQGREVPAGQIGELVVRASLASPRQGFFSGYYKDAAATEAAWKDGWLHTGDLARRDPEGSFFFAGRRKQIIRRSGENISAAEVEAAVGADSRVRAAAIVGVPDAVREEEVFACIVVRNDVEPSLETARAIMGSLAQQLSYFKLPGYIAFVSELPVTATQKLRYGAVAEQALALLAGSDPHVFDMRSEKSQSRRAAAQGPRQC